MKQCPYRDECWNDLNAPAIEQGIRGATPGRKIPCGFETTGTLHNCLRRARYGMSGDLESVLVQLPMDGLQQPQKAA
jgi:hypothetical protein